LIKLLNKKSYEEPSTKKLGQKRSHKEKEIRPYDAFCIKKTARKCPKKKSHEELGDTGKCCFFY